MDSEIFKLIIYGIIGIIIYRTVKIDGWIGVPRIVIMISFPTAGFIIPIVIALENNNALIIFPLYAIMYAIAFFVYLPVMEKMDNFIESAKGIFISEIGRRAILNDLERKDYYSKKIIPERYQTFK